MGDYRDFTSIGRRPMFGTPHRSNRTFRDVDGQRIIHHTPKTSMTHNPKAHHSVSEPSMFTKAWYWTLRHGIFLTLEYWVIFGGLGILLRWLQEEGHIDMDFDSAPFDIIGVVFGFFIFGDLQNAISKYNTAAKQFREMLDSVEVVATNLTAGYTNFNPADLSDIVDITLLTSFFSDTVLQSLRADTNKKEKADTVFGWLRDTCCGSEQDAIDDVVMTDDLMLLDSDDVALFDSLVGSLPVTSGRAVGSDFVEQRVDALRDVIEAYRESRRGRPTYDDNVGLPTIFANILSQRLSSIRARGSIEPSAAGIVFKNMDAVYTNTTNMATNLLPPVPAILVNLLKISLYIWITLAIFRFGEFSFYGAILWQFLVIYIYMGMYKISRLISDPYTLGSDRLVIDIPFEEWGEGSKDSSLTIFANASIFKSKGQK